MIEEITALRQRGHGLITIGGWSVTALLSVLAFFLGQPAFLAALGSAALNIGPTVHAKQKRVDSQARMVLLGDVRSSTVGCVTAIFLQAIPVSAQSIAALRMRRQQAIAVLA